MSNVFTLDDIRAAAEKKFGNTEIDLGEKGKVTLVNALQLPKDQRKALEKIQERLGEDDAEQDEVLKDAIRIVGRPAAAAEALLEEVGDNFAMLLQVFTNYSEGTQVGEA